MSIEEYLKVEEAMNEYTYDEKSRKCFEKSSGKEVTDKRKIMEIKSNLFVINYIEYNTVREQMWEKLRRLKAEGNMQELNKVLKDYESIQPDNLLYLKKQKGASLTLGQEEIVKEMKRKRLEDFIQKIENVVKNSDGNVNFSKNIMAPTKVAYDFFTEQPDLGEAYIKSVFLKNGIKLDNFKMQIDKDVISHTLQISSTPVKDRNIQKDDIYNATKSVRLTEVFEAEEEVKKLQRTNYIRRHLLSLYGKAENDVMFSDRAGLEENDIMAVLKAVKEKNISPNMVSKLGLDEIRMGNDKTMYTTFSVKRLLCLLKAANNITLDYGENYLGEFASLEPIHTIIGYMVSNKENLKFLEEMAENNDGKERKTISERDVERANKYLKRENNPIALMKKSHVTGDRCILDSGVENLSYSNVPEEIKDKLALIRVISRQDGKTPEKPVIEGRNIKFAVNDRCKEM